MGTVVGKRWESSSVHRRTPPSKMVAILVIAFFCSGVCGGVEQHIAVQKFFDVGSSLFGQVLFNGVPGGGDKDVLKLAFHMGNHGRIMERVNVNQNEKFEYSG